VRPSRKTWVTIALLSSAVAAAMPAGPASAAGVTLSVTTLSPSAVTPDGAALNAGVLVAALGASVNFQYGTTTNYGSVSGASATSLLGVAETLTVPVVGLQPATTYHVRAKATSLLATSEGRDLTFTTPARSAAPTTPSPGDAPAAPATGTPVPGVPAPVVPGLGAPGAKAPTSGGSGPAATTPDGGSAATDPGAGAGDAPAPALGQTVGVETVRGAVTVMTPSGRPVDLATATTLPTGTVIDARKGTVALTSAVDRKGTVQTGRFWGGVFEVRQRPTGKGLTELVLRGGDFHGCPPAATARRSAAVAHAAKAAKPPRALWGSDRHGRFQTRGRGSVATVRGTRWYTEDRCAGTLTRVTQGAVSVYDLGRHRATTVTRGHAYLARTTR
jgi:hypothetical protein